MKAHLVQTDIRWEDKAANFAAVQRLLEEARPAPGDLAVLPEMFDTGFSFRLEHTADTARTTLDFLENLARELRITVHGSRTTVGPDGRGRNCATIVGPDGLLLCEFEKIHPFTLGKEVDYFTGGDAVKVYPWVTGREQENRRTGEQVKGSEPSISCSPALLLSSSSAPLSSSSAPQASATVCPAVCYDLRFPELFRIGLLKGAEIFAIGSSWPATREQHRQTLSIARAIENQAFVLSVNRCGKDPTLEYAGGTLAISPRGEVLGQLGGVEGVLSVAIDMDDLRRWRRTFPAWKDHRLIGRMS